MTDKDLIKALECLCGFALHCRKCPYSPRYQFPLCQQRVAKDTLDLITRQQEEIDILTYTLLGVMHSVDKWLDGAELEQDEVNRAATMREKTLRIAEEKQAEIERLKNQPYTLQIEVSKKIESQIKSEAVKEFAEKLNDRIVNLPSVYPIESATLAFLNGSAHRQLEILEIIDNLLKEMVGDNSNE